MKEDLEWIRDRAWEAYENDSKLRASSARTMKRIAERADKALEGLTVSRT